MKILFIVPYPTEGQSNRFRVEQYLPELTQRGISYSVRPFYSSNFRKILQKKGHYLKKIFYLLIFSISRLADVLKSPNYDIVFIHREAFPAKGYIFEWLFRKMAKRLIYDFDDSVFLTKPAKVRRMVIMSDYIITGNGFLRDYVLKFNKKVGILPTCIDTDKYKPAQKSGDSQKVIIGWMGSPTTVVYLSELGETFKILSKKYNNVEFRVIGAKFDNNLVLPLVNKDWTMDSEIGELQQFDIGLMPMPEDEWTKGKCAFKIVQYMAVGVPAIASPVGMNTEIIRDGVNGFLASGTKEWCEKLSQLIESPGLRKQFGRMGRKTVEDEYSLNKKKSEFVNILERSTKG